MKAFAVIFKKEVTDTMRDKRTILAMVVIPLLLFPLIITLMSKIGESQAEKAESKILRIAVIGDEYARRLEEFILADERMQLVPDVPEDSVRSLIQADSLDGAFVFSPKFEKRIEAMRSGRVKFYFRSTEDQGIKKDRMLRLTQKLEKELLAERFQKLNLDEKAVEAVNLVEVDITSTKERFGKAIGGFLPYIFVIFCFIGSMYPAIDLAAGEKERGTLETLLTAPVSRFEILLGKFGVVVMTGIGSAAVSIIGLYIGIRQAGDIPPEIMEVILGILQPQTIIMLISLLLPLTMFFAGLLLSLSMFAKTFKEAQSIITPVNIIVIVPVAIGLVPGIELNATTALIPVLNVSLATKGIIAGTIDYALLAEVYASLIALAGLSLFASSKMFQRESVIFRA